MEAEKEPWILVVDDDPSMQRFVTRVIGDQAPHTVVGSASDAIRELRVGDYGLLVSDINLGDGDGLGLASTAIGRQWVDQAILITGAPELGSATRAVELNIAAYIDKRDLKTTLPRVLARASLKHRCRQPSARRLRRVLDESAMLHFQPIVDANSRAHMAHEALLRPGDKTFSTPLTLLACAENHGMLPEVGRRVRVLASNALAETVGLSELFVNTNVAELTDPAILDRNPLFPHAERVVLEISEQGPLDITPKLLDTIGKLRAAGFRFALDDVGSGNCRLAAMEKLRPEFIKIDRQLTAMLRDTVNTRVVSMLSDIAHSYGGQVIVEGVEDGAAAEAAVEAGADRLQGYHFGRPRSL